MTRSGDDLEIFARCSWRNVVFSRSILGGEDITFSWLDIIVRTYNSRMLHLTFPHKMVQSVQQLMICM